MPETVWVVLGQFNYDTADAILAFTSEEAAKAAAEIPCPIKREHEYQWTGVCPLHDQHFYVEVPLDPQS